MSESSVVFSRIEAHPVAVATLNRPASLNALTLEMCVLLGKQLQLWADDDSVKCVVLNANGKKGFCAGGDVAEVVRHVRSSSAMRFDYGDAFFTTEYALDLMIHTYPKPLIALSHGICMGGGVGLIAGANHRLFAAGSKIAMPEIHIGLFPDVGGGYFLNQFPNGAGTLMAMSGAVIDENDAHAIGLADYVVGPEAATTLIDEIVAIEWSDDAQANEELLHMLFVAAESCHDRGESRLTSFASETKALAASADAIAYRDALTALAAREPYFATAAKSLAQGSPTAAHVTFEYLRRAEGLDIDEVLTLDLTVAKQCQRHHDFSEGVRALLIDKDKTPKWSPADWGAVDRALVERHFANH